MDDMYQRNKPHFSQGVTDVYVTTVHSDKVPAFRQWLKTLHHLEAKFPGFQKVYVQIPKDPQDESWVTLLQFDTEEHLEAWVQSPERQAKLKEAANFVKSQESHRLFSSVDSWFFNGEALDSPPVWKQAMLILLALFPSVMLETIYFFPYMADWNIVVNRFIGVIIIVCSMSWLLMPITLYLLGWWLKAKSKMKKCIGALLILSAYILEIGFFLSIYQG